MFIFRIIIFLPRDAIHKRGPCRHAVSVHPSVCHVRALCRHECTASSIFFTVRSPHYSSSSVPNVMAIFWRAPRPLTGASNAGGVGKNRDSRKISVYRSMTAAVHTNATAHRAVYRTDHHALVDLCLSQPAWTTTTKSTKQDRTEFNCT